MFVFEGKVMCFLGMYHVFGHAFFLMSCSNETLTTVHNDDFVFKKYTTRTGCVYKANMLQSECVTPRSINIAVMCILVHSILEELVQELFVYVRFK